MISGTAAIQTLLNRPDMQFQVQRNAAGTADEPVPTCINIDGSGQAGPARRFLELTKAFGDNGAVISICEPSYGPAMQALVQQGRFPAGAAAALQSRQIAEECLPARTALVLG
ncbi:MAG TPA: hypothetical protein VJU61_00320 [Polyangiaceae bacterium]|nr:hypothetical protein [Polyangiaceae bacterium]